MIEVLRNETRAYLGREYEFMRGHGHWAKCEGCGGWIGRTVGRWRSRIMHKKHTYRHAHHRYLHYHEDCLTLAQIEWALTH